MVSPTGWGQVDTHSVKMMVVSRIPLRTLIGAVLLATLVRSSLASQTIDASPRAYEIVADVALRALPNPLRGLLEGRAEEIRRIASTELLHVPTARDHGPGEAASHFILLDVGDQTRDRNGPSAVRRFPRSEVAARKFFARHGVTEGGSLPWTLLRRVDDLSKAFRQHDLEKVVRAVGAVVHFATDAALPFNTVSDETNRRGFHVDLLSEYGDRFAYEVRVFPGRLGSASSPIDDVFATLLAAYDTVPRLRVIVEQSAAISKSTWGSPAAKLLKQIESKGGCAIIESRLEDGALLAANLIVGAWVTADRPELRGDAITAAPASAGSVLVADWVGSVNSTIVHKAGCPHARRIRPANRVTFTSAFDARQAGRSACKTCKPVLPPRATHPSP